MYYKDIYENQLHHLIKNALAEDIGDGDHSTLACIDPDTRGKAILKNKRRRNFSRYERCRKNICILLIRSSVIKKFKQDGDQMQPGEIAFEVDAKIYDILTCERLVLNCMQRMCGIATLTKKYVDKLKGYHTKLLDTRKTTPNFRILEKEAVRIGGGFNHQVWAL